MVSSWASGMEPCCGVSAGNYILFDTEGWNIKAVNDVLRGQNHFDVASDGDMQFIDFTMAFFVLEFPHPLFSNDVNFCGSARRGSFLKKDDGTPDEDDHKNAQWYDRPGN